MRFAFFVFFSLFFMNDWITLEDLKWKKRVLLFFPTQQEATIWELTDSLKNEIEGRDLVYFVFYDSLVSNTDHQFSKTYIEEIKARYLLGSRNQCWVLLGKDGGLKLRKEEEDLDWEELLVTIDAMHMK